MQDTIRIGCAVPDVTVADTMKNAQAICDYIARADSDGCNVVVFPELAVTGYTCGDLFFQQLLLEGTKRAFAQIVHCCKAHPAVTAVVGLPVMIDCRLYNCAAVMQGGAVQGIVPKTFLPNHAEAEERRWFASGVELGSRQIDAKTLGLEGNYAVPVGAGQIFSVGDVKLGVEVCEDLFAPTAPSTAMALGGAEVIVNPAASVQLAGKQAYRRKLVAGQSENGRCVYAFCSAGCGESTRDTVFSGHSVIAQQGKLLAENRQLVDSGYLMTADADIGALRAQRCRDTSFRAAASMPVCACGGAGVPICDGYVPEVDPHPFFTSAEECGEIFAIQTAALSQRLKLLGAKAVLGVSGGLDSTLALLVAVEAMHRLKRPATDVVAITMPGFGTTDRTYDNAVQLMKLLDVTVQEIPIREAVLQHFQDIGHDPAVHDLTYENAQARERTQILMDYAGKHGGIVVGTGDLSELALGWCTYNGDHMSMYGVNASVPKTLIPHIIHAVVRLPRYAMAAEVLQDVIDTPISPELLPPDDKGNIAQQTEDLVGPYVLHDFYLYHTLKNGFAPRKVYDMACRAFPEYGADTVKKWLKTFYRRFFTQQFKRNCMPEGVKVLDVSLSPRADWHMPGDVSASLWLAEVDRL